MAQTKQLQDHTKRRQSVEDQAPYGEHINSKACGTHSHRTPSHLHMPLICIFTKRPLWLSLISKPLPTASSAHAGLTKENQAGWQRVPAGTTHAHIQLIHTYTQMHKINFCTHGIQMCNGRVNRKIRKRVSEIWRCEHWPCSSNFHPSFPLSLPSSSSRLSLLSSSGTW